ncbi:MAG: type I glyceraldehyde-3-phosphate dehydrogenase [Parcubacteria group bacterium]|jgi:glyceraldehyde 3-phosphate dehydrogenase|nr:type I glyceraldehyde-3-phosphate dehydrogenase [Parcubacteria group bacterium]|tara:strand:- start:3169 stop:4191 length:1023 start_codon:yes stop_codon:yes gene_type:complete
MVTKIAINGFGRIGRATFKAALENKNLEVVALNDLMDNKLLAHLLQYDTAYGLYHRKVLPTKNGIKIDGKEYLVFHEAEPAKLPWKKFAVEVLLECTGRFKTKKDASGHLKAGAKRIIISAPAKDNTQTLVYGTKHTGDCVKKDSCDDIVSMASCTTNCISPVIQVLESKFGVEKALMTTIHSYTSTQNLVDGPNKDLRRTRAAALNMIPTTTGAAEATTKVVPGVKNMFDGIAIRVPTITGSLSDITAVLKRKKVTVKQINDEFKTATKHPLYKNILAVSSKPLVSSDYIGNPYSATVDLEFTRVVGGNLVKILAWYDNEYAYSLRLTEMAEQVGRLTK